MDSKKYIGMDVHQASISVAVLDTAGKLLMECIIETKAATILEFVQGLHGSLWVGVARLIGHCRGGSNNSISRQHGASRG